MRIVRELMPALWLLTVYSVSFGQVSTGAISGTVSDSTGAVLPGVKVVVLNEDTGISRTVQTDASGRYVAPSLTLGRYRVTATLQGFQTEARNGVVLTVGREAVVNLQLTVGSMVQSVEVTGEAPLVESTSSAMGGLVDDRTMRELPLNGRSYDQLALLQAGVTAYGGGATSGGFNYGAGTRFSVAGSRGYNNSFLLDGTDINDAANATPGGAAGTNLGVEAIREFKMLTNNFSAEYGRATGAVITAVTKSGTNQYHGTAFHFIRNSALDARNFFDVKNSPPPFKRNQFGGVFGGPIKKDQTFFLGAYEGMRQRLGTTTLVTVPTASAKNGILPTSTVNVNPVIQPFLKLWPNPNGRDFGDGTGEFVSAPTVPTNQDYFIIRMDYQLSEKHSFFGRYSFDNDSVEKLDGLLFAVSKGAARRQYSTFQISSIFRPTVLNAFRFAYNRSAQISDTLPVEKLGPEVSFIPGLPIGRLEIGGRAATAARRITGLGTSDSVPRSWIYNLFEAGDDVTYIKGNHSFKLGGSFKRIRDNTAQNTSLRGIYTFSSFANVLAGQASNFAAVRPGQSAYRGIRQSMFAVFGQDDVRVTPRLTLNLGLRWEAVSDPTEVNGLASNLVHVTDPRVTILDSYFEVSKRNFEPRVGFAWQANQSGTLVIRGGFGIFHDQILPVYYAVNVAKYPPFFDLLNLENPRFPDASRDLTTSGLLRLNAVATSLKTPAKNHYTFSIQQQLFKNTVLEVGYVGSKSTNVPRFGEQNTRSYTLINGQKFFPANSPRKNPNFDEIRTVTTDTNGHYDAMQIKLRRSTSSNLQFQVSYTFSRAIDQASAIATVDSAREAQASLDPEDPARDRGRASFDATNNVVINFGYPLPLRFERKLASFFLSGWEITGIATITDGQPFSVRLGTERSRNGGGGRADRPDLAPARSNNPILSRPDKWYDPTAFLFPAAGTYGNVGRNTLIGPGKRVFDLSLLKQFRFKESSTVQFRAEFFNLFNHANFGLPSNRPFTSSGSISGSAGRITDTVTTSRQIQFGLKLIF